MHFFYLDNRLGFNARKFLEMVQRQRSEGIASWKLTPRGVCFHHIGSTLCQNSSQTISSTLLGERTDLITRFRRACPGSERTSDGYIELPIMPPFPRESPEAIPGEMGGEWRAAVW